MSLTRNRLYSVLSVALIAGYSWLFYELLPAHSAEGSEEVGCLIKRISGIPCPSCGSTRSVISLLNGDLVNALYINPLGVIIALIMFITPFWILFDLISKNQTLFDFYCNTEVFLRKPKIAIPLIALVLINWIWNISKGF